MKDIRAQAGYRNSKGFFVTLAVGSPEFIRGWVEGRESSGVIKPRIVARNLGDFCECGPDRKEVRRTIVGRPDQMGCINCNRWDP